MNKQEKIIKEVISRFGDKIDLRKTPHVIIEIISQFRSGLDPIKRMDCQPPGGPPKIGAEVILIEDIMVEIKALSSQVKRLHAKVDNLKKR
jgi:hypothetical protein